MGNNTSKDSEDFANTDSTTTLAFPVSPTSESRLVQSFNFLKISPGADGDSDTRDASFSSLQHRHQSQSPFASFFNSIGSTSSPIFPPYRPEMDRDTTMESLKSPSSPPLLQGSKGQGQKKNPQTQIESAETSASSAFSPLAISSTTISPRMNMKSTSKITPTASASTSFDERFKYKISIYSKVSGCRMTNLLDYTIVKQIRVVILEYIAKGDPNLVPQVKFAYEKMKNGGLQVITDDYRLSNALSELGYFAAIPCKMTFPNSPRVVGFVKDLPVNMEPAELKKEVRKLLPEVYSVRYITERRGGRTRPMQRPSAFVSFNLRYLPGFIRVYGRDYEILVPNPMQCTRCCRYGHQGKQCRAEMRCSICGKQHPKQHCTSTTYRCVNCKGMHYSTSHECPVWQQGKLMNELRYRGGLTAEEAIDVASDGKIQHKKHSFISPDEYFEELESFYLGNGSDECGEAEIEADRSDSPEDPDISPTSMDPSLLDDSGNRHKTVMLHPRYIAAQEFLDMLTDFYLKLTNPDANYTSSILMPGFEDDSILQRQIKLTMNLNNENETDSKQPSKIAQEFKLSVLRTIEAEQQLKSILC